jgi:hypothetical protein
MHRGENARWCGQFPRGKAMREGTFYDSGISDSDKNLYKTYQ